MHFLSRWTSCLPRRSAQCAALLFLCTAFFCAAPAAAKEDGPLAALVKAQRGIDEADSSLVDEAMDVNAVLNKASSVLIAHLRQQAAAGALGEGNMAITMALTAMGDENSPQAAFFKQMLISEVKGFMVSGINGGYFAGKPNGRITPPQMSLASTLTKMPEGRREIVPGKILSNKDGKASVSATFVDPGAGRLPLILALERQGENWRVVEITNAASLFATAGKPAP